MILLVLAFTLVAAHFAAPLISPALGLPSLLGLGLVLATVSTVGLTATALVLAVGIMVPRVYHFARGPAIMAALLIGGIMTITLMATISLLSTGRLQLAELIVTIGIALLPIIALYNNSLGRAVYINEAITGWPKTSILLTGFVLLLTMTSTILKFMQRAFRTDTYTEQTAGIRLFFRSRGAVRSGPIQLDWTPASA